MPDETLNCNECGALIQVPSTARYVTCNRCGAHLVVQRTGIAT
jgi:DNA-directed RNA polymerase subunit RPC12/RpoP